MDMYNLIKELTVKKYGEDYLLRQLAEECAELAQAALKVIRARHGETPVTPEEARAKLLEEIADVMVMAAMVLEDDGEIDAVDEIMDAKAERMLYRLAMNGKAVDA